VTTWNRRQVLGAGTAAASGLWVPRAGRAASGDYNVLCVVVDSLPAEVVGPHPRDPEGVWSRCMPRLNQVAAQGFVARSAVAVHPEPGPALAAMWTGRPGSETGAMVGGLPAARDLPILSDWIAENGAADVFVAGGPSVPGRAPGKRVEVVLSDERSAELGNEAVVRAVTGVLRNRAPGRRWLGVVNLRGLTSLDGLLLARSRLDRAPDFGLPDRDLPPAPPRDAPDGEPALIHAAVRAPLDLSTWTDKLWRHHLWEAQPRLAQLDRQLGALLDVLAGTVHRDNTVVMVTAACGHPLGRHGLARFGAPYATALDVPWVFGNIPAGKTDFLVSGLDVAPTLCDFLGTPQMPSARGYSIRPLLDQKTGAWRQAIQAEALIDGRVVRTAEFSYVRFRGEGGELLFHRRNDPLEQRNLAEAPGYSSTVASHREYLVQLEQFLEPTEASDRGYGALPEAVRSGP
jgi:arylsulfatase A-like enzyme